MYHDKPVISIILDRRRPLASGKFPVRLRATFRIVKEGKPNWVQKHYPCKFEDGRQIALSPKEFESVKGDPRIPAMKNVRLRIKAIEGRALKVLDKHERVGLDLFEKEFLGAPLTGVIPFFTRYIDQLTELDQIGTARVYRTARNSFEKYAGNFYFPEVNEMWLKKYVSDMRKRDRAVTTIAINLRCLKKIFNDAVAEKYVSADYYPFGKRRFSIQEERKPKKALNEKQKNQVLAFKTKDKEIREGIDYWILSYFCNGINPADIARLTFKQISGGVMRVNRTKTMNTTKVLRTIEIPIHKTAAGIIAKYRKKSLDPDEYVFQVLVKGLSVKQQKFRIEDWIAKLNDGLRRATVKLKFDFPFTTMTARHTFANIARLQGASDEFIQVALGHESPETTRIYLDGFDMETKRKMSEKL